MSKQSPGRDSLVYERSRVSWATAQFVEEAPAWSARAFVYILSFALVAALVYSGFSRIAISVDARGSILPQESVVPIKASVSFTVGKLYAEENRTVSKGDLLVESEYRLSDDDFERLLSEQKTIADLLKRHATQKCQDCLSRLHVLANTSFKLEAKGGDLQDVVGGVRQLLLDYLTYADAVRSLPETNRSIRRQIRIAEKKLREIRRRGATEMLAVQVEQLTSEIVSARAQLTERRQGTEQQYKQAHNRLEVKLASVGEAARQYRAQQTLKAPISGIVTELGVGGAGELVSAGAPLMRIVPIESGLKAVLYVANKDIARIEPGMGVKLKLDALPEREYGTATGKVESIPANVSDPGKSGMPVYEVAVELDQQALTKDGVEYPFRLGMTLSALVITKYESLLMVGLRKVFKLKDDIFED